MRYAPTRIIPRNSGNYAASHAQSLDSAAGNSVHEAPSPFHERPDYFHIYTNNNIESQERTNLTSHQHSYIYGISEESPPYTDGAPTRDITSVISRLTAWVRKIIMSHCFVRISKFTITVLLVLATLNTFAAGTRYRIIFLWSGIKDIGLAMQKRAAETGKAILRMRRDWIRKTV